jgi:hypothetical protein
MRKFFPLIAIVAVIALSCSGSKESIPTTPGSLSSERTGQRAPGRTLLGMWDIAVSADRQTVELIPMRAADLHLNVTRLIEVAPCSTCLTISNLKVLPPDKIQVDLKLQHPFAGLIKYTGFDVRGIFISQADYDFPSSGRTIAWGDSVPKLLDGDGYTSLFNPTEFPETKPAALGYIPGKKATGGWTSPATLNPFVAYAKDKPRRMFEAGSAETKTVTIQAPAGPLHFGYAIDVSWFPADNVIDPETDFPASANCIEAYQISAEAGAGLTPSMGSATGVTVKV